MLSTITKEFEASTKLNSLVGSGKAVRLCIKHALDSRRHNRSDLLARGAPKIFAGILRVLDRAGLATPLGGELHEALLQHLLPNRPCTEAARSTSFQGGLKQAVATLGEIVGPVATSSLAILFAALTLNESPSDAKNGISSGRYGISSHL